MADDTLQKLGDAIATPIAQLSSELSDPSSRAVRGLVTIVWPYSSAKNSFAFILAEPEFRLRPAKGQIRLNFTGASAKAISECGLRSSDEVLLSLDGAQWEEDTSRMSGHVWQLKYSERLSLQVKLSETGETKNVEIDHPVQPEPEESAAPLPEPEVETTAPDPIYLPPSTTSISSTLASSNDAPTRKLNYGEFESPAFIKRARISYGALFEDGIDIFEDDGGVKGRGRKRTRFGRESGAWRYSSQSRSPEPIAQQKDNSIDDEDEKRPSSSPHPEMTDDGCQTMELDFPDPQPISNGTGLELTHKTPQPVQVTNPFIGNGVFFDQGHQTFPLNSWTSAVPTPQLSFADSGIFGSSQEHTVPFGSNLEPSISRDQTQRLWESQSAEDHSIPYPALPLDPRQDLLVTPVEDHSDSLSTAPPGSFRPGGVGGESNSNVVEDGHSDLVQPITNYPPLSMVDAGQRLSPPHPALQNIFETATGPSSSLAQESDTVPVNPFSQGSGTSPDGGAIDAGTSSWAPINSTTSRATSPPPTGRLDSNHGRTSESALVIDESESDEEDEDQLGEDIADGPAAPLLNRRISTDDSRPGSGHFDISEAEYEEEALYYEDLERGDEEDEEGGDYDARNYLAPEDDQDDSHDEDLRPHRLEPQFDDGEGESWDEDQGVDEDEEYETDYDMDDERPQSQIRPQPPFLQRQQAPPSVSGPVVIDLLSSSEDEDEETQPPRRTVPSSMPSSQPVPVASQPATGPLDHGFESQDEAEIEDDDEYDSENGLDQGNGHVEDHDESDLEEDGEDYSEDEDLGSEDDALSDNENPEAITEGGASKYNTEVEDVKMLEKHVQEEDGRILAKADTQSVASQRGTSPVPQSDTAAMDQMDKDAVMRDSTPVELAAESRQEENKPIDDTQLEEEELSEVDVVKIRGLDQESTQPVLHEDVPEARQDAPTMDHTLHHDKPSGQILPDSDMLPPAADIQEQVEQRAVEMEMVAASSPPLTQSFQSQVPEEKHEVVTQETTIIVESQDPAGQLPTPLATQPMESTMCKETIIFAAMDVDEVKEVVEVEEVEQVKEVDEIEDQAQAPSSPVTNQGTVERELDEVSQRKDLPVQPSQTASYADEGYPGRHEALRVNDVDDVTTEDIAADDASSFKSQMDGDDALQAALREEDSRFISQPSSPILDSTSPKGQGEVEAEITVATPELSAAVVGKPEPVEEATEESPTLDPSVRLARAAIASKKGGRRGDATPETTRPHTRSRSFQKSPTPNVGDDSIQLARASLHTPSKTAKAESKAEAKATVSSPASSKVEEEAGSLTASKLKLVRYLRDELPDLTNLKVLRQHTGKSLNVMAVAMMSPADPQRAKGGPREYMMSFTITDHSVGPNGVAEVQLYRPHKEFLPKVKAGDVVLLRNFSVLSLKGKGFGLRTNDSSSWAVFDREDEPAQVKGPPIEYGDEEANFAAYLRDWFGLLDEKAKGKLEGANQKIIEAGRSK